MGDINIGFLALSVGDNILICADCMIGTGGIIVRDIDKSGAYTGISEKRLGKEKRSCLLKISFLEELLMKKKIWIFNHHANEMFFNNGGRHYNFAKYLKQKGYEPTIFVSNAVHGDGKTYFDCDDTWHEHINEKINVPFVFVKGRPYVGNGKNRVLCMLDYYKNVKLAAEEYVKTHGKPDLIIGSQVHPLAVLAAEKMAQKYHIRCIAEFRDLWPESIVAIGKAKKTNPIIIGMRVLERHLYKHADRIIFTIEGGYDYIKERRWDRFIPTSKVYHINNGVDLPSFYSNAETITIDDPVLLNNDYFKVVYAGTIREANGLEELIESANVLKDVKKIRFLIYGDGERLDDLKIRVNNYGLENVFFRGRVTKQSVPFILSKGDLNLLNYNATAAVAGLYRFGSSQNKLFEYFASGKPILSNFKTGYDLIEKYHCGISKNILGAKEYAENLKKIVDMDRAEYEMLCSNAKQAAEEYDYQKLTEKLIDVIENA